MTTQTKSPEAVGTAPEANKFQQTKQILTLALLRTGAIFSSALCLGDTLPMMAALLVLLALGVSQ